MRRWWWIVVVVLVAGGGVHLLTRPEGTWRTDEEADKLAECASRYEIPRSAAGFARRMERSPYNTCGQADVLEYTDLDSDDPYEPLARVVLRIHHDAYESRFVGEFSRPAVTACYRVEFNSYGPDGGPSRVHCVADAPAVTPTPAPAKEVPPSFDDVFRHVLGSLGTRPTADAVRAALLANLPRPPKDRESYLASYGITAQDVAVDGEAVGITAYVRFGDTKLSCLLGVRRADGTITVWRADRNDVPPEEKAPCSAQMALRG